MRIMKKPWPEACHKIHLDIENHVASNLLITNHIIGLTMSVLLWFLALIDHPSIFDLQHFLVNHRLLEAITSFIINFQCLFNRMWQADSKLVSCPPVS
jgi:hypothetical protein